VLPKTAEFDTESSFKSASIRLQIGLQLPPLYSTEKAPQIFAGHHGYADQLPVWDALDV